VTDSVESNIHKLHNLSQRKPATKHKPTSSVRENVRINSRNVKSHVFLDFEKKTLKNVRIVSEATNHSAFNYTYTITGIALIQEPWAYKKHIRGLNIRNVQQWLRMDHTPGAGN